MIEATTMSNLASQAQKYADWLLMKRFCDQIYGEDKATKVRIDTDAESDDEGGSNYSLSWITAYDIKGKELEYDLSLSFWKLDLVQEMLKTYAEDNPELDEEDKLESAREALKEIYWPFWDKERQRPDNLVLWEDFSIDKNTDDEYDLTQPPDSPLLTKYGIL